MTWLIGLNIYHTYKGKYFGASTIDSILFQKCFFLLSVGNQSTMIHFFLYPGETQQNRSVSEKLTLKPQDSIASTKHSWW